MYQRRAHNLVYIKTCWCVAGVSWENTQSIIPSKEDSDRWAITKCI